MNSFSTYTHSYFEAEMSKIRKGGWMWWDPINMRRTLYGSTLDPMQFDWQATLHLIDAPDILIPVMVIKSIVISTKSVAERFAL